MLEIRVRRRNLCTIYLARRRHLIRTAMHPARDRRVECVRRPMTVQLCALPKTGYIRSAANLSFAAADDRRFNRQ